MKKFWKFNDAIDYTKKQMYDYCYVVHTEKWQGKEIKDDDRYAMIEILNHSFSCAISSDIKELVKQIKPNVQWADEHFDERVSGTPFNPPPSHERWPYAQKNNGEFGGNEKFSHTYPERIWPKYAGENFIHSATTDYQDPPNKGIRFDYGDFNDVVELLLKEPLTRQAYLPIWFPEDTGGAGGARVPCFVGETEIQTDRGYLPISDINLNDRVVTHNGRFKNVIKIYKSDYKKDIIRISTTNTNTKLNTTDDHPFLIIKNKGYIPSHPKFEWKEEWVEASKINKNDYVVHSFINDTDDDFAISSDIMRLFGYYLADGEILFDKRRGRKKPKTIRFNMSDKDEDRGFNSDIIKIMYKEFGINPIIRRKDDVNDNKNIRIYFHSTEVAEKIYSIFGTGSYDKKIPEFILRAPKELQLELLIGYTRGDGSFEPNKKNMECTSVSPSLIMGLRTIMFRNGIYNSLQKRNIKKPYFNKRLNRIIKPNYPTYKLVFPSGGRFTESFFGIKNDKNVRKEYKKAWIKDNHVLFQIRYIDIVKNDSSVVYNLLVEDDNTYNTINCTVHNCSLGYHFIMRHGYLHVNYYIRSCDFFRHFRDDVYLCARKVLWLLDELQQKNPYWDKIKPGFLTMHITSLHAFHHEKYLLNR